MKKAITKALAWVGLLLLTLVGCSPTGGGLPLTALTGSVAGSDALIALVVEGNQLTAYTCGADQTWRSQTGWFDAQFSGSSFETQNVDGLRLKGTVSASSASGTLELPSGEVLNWQASAADPTGRAGLYRASDGEGVTGLIVTSQGQANGVSYAASGEGARVQLVQPLSAALAGNQVQVQTSIGGQTRIFEVSRLTAVSSQSLGSQVPLGLQRKAAQLVEDLRGSPDTPEWGNTAKLSGAVVPFFRPDINGVAYYEFAVSPSGFVLVSTAAHDFPIPHWQSAGKTLSASLSDTAKKQGFSPSRLLKLDALAYAAESSDGSKMATNTTRMVRVTGLQNAWLTNPPTGSVEAVASANVSDDKDAGNLSFSFTSSGAKDAPLTLGKWGSWTELKANYKATYAVLLEALRRGAAPDWNTDDLAQRFGEGIPANQTHRVVLLGPDPKLSLSGEGAKLATVSLDTAGSVPVALLKTSAGSGRTDFDLSITYGNGLAERLRYFVGSVAATKLDTSAWGNWTTSSAGREADQRRYFQFEIGDCYSGCGATAWAMLFGWADHRAANNDANWRNRSGIYRVGGGGRSATDTAAPADQDSGIEAMTAETRTAMGSYCVDIQAATNPWDMHKAQGYLQGRTAATVRTEWSTGIASNDFRNRARDSIRNKNTPAIIGTGFLEHYPLAYKYRVRSRTVQSCFLGCSSSTEYQRQFKVNQGWDADDAVRLAWIPAETWFVGELRP